MTLKWRKNKLESILQEGLQKKAYILIGWAATKDTQTLLGPSPFAFTE